MLSIEKIPVTQQKVQYKHNFTPEQETIIKCWDRIRKVDSRFGNFNLNVAFAQFALESGAAQSVLYKNGKNGFGIKGKYKGKYLVFDDDEPNEKFMKFDTFEECVTEYFKVIQKDRYHKVFRSPDFYHQAKALKEAGYATDRWYPRKLLKLNPNIPNEDFDKYLIEHNNMLRDSNNSSN